MARGQALQITVQADVRSEWGLPGFALILGHSQPLL